MEDIEFGRLIYLSLILASLIGWALVEFRQRMGQALRMALAWGAIFLAMMGGYGVWQDLQGRSQGMMVTGEQRVELRRQSDGHYYVTLRINGTEVYFVIDTGATGMVLTLEDAERLGFDRENLVFLGEASTANGMVRTAMVTLGAVELGPFRDANFRAYVNEGELSESLLGMDYLERFRMEFVDGTLVLER